MMPRFLIFGIALVSALFLGGCLGGGAATTPPPSTASNFSTDPLAGSGSSMFGSSDVVSTSAGTEAIIQSAAADDVLVPQPEPSSILLLGSSLAGLGVLRYRFRMKRRPAIGRGASPKAN